MKLVIVAVILGLAAIASTDELTQLLTMLPLCTVCLLFS
jgi:hypothetical protein